MSERNDFIAPDGLARIRAETFVREIDYHRELPSTNDLALELSTMDDLPLPLLVLAEHQTAGRGRGANSWWANPGSLTFSLVIETEKVQIPVDRWPQISLTVGLSVCEAIESLLPDCKIGLKWPNDVHLNDRKVCGILVEVPPERNGRLVLGIGLNVNNSFELAPRKLRGLATSLSDVGNREFTRAGILVDLLNLLAGNLEALAASDFDLSRRWKERCVLTGKTVHHSSGAEQTLGVCDGIDIDGALLIRTEQGAKRFYGGILTHVE